MVRADNMTGWVGKTHRPFADKHDKVGMDGIEIQKNATFWHFCAILSPLTLFLLNFDHGWRCLTGSDKHFRKQKFLIPCPVYDVWHQQC